MPTRMLATCLSIALTACGTELSDSSTAREHADDVGLGSPLEVQVIAQTASPLTNGVTVTGLAGSLNSENFFYLDVPANKPVSFVTTAGSGDVDLYVKFGAQPTLNSFDCRPYQTGSNETCNMPAKNAAGRYYVMLRGFKAYINVSLTGTY